MTTTAAPPKECPCCRKLFHGWDITCAFCSEHPPYESCDPSPVVAGGSSAPEPDPAPFAEMCECGHHRTAHNPTYTPSCAGCRCMAFKAHCCCTCNSKIAAGLRPAPAPEPDPAPPCGQDFGASQRMALLCTREAGHEDGHSYSKPEPPLDPCSDCDPSFGCFDLWSAPCQKRNVQSSQEPEPLSPLLIEVQRLIHAGHSGQCLLCHPPAPAPEGPTVAQMFEECWHERSKLRGQLDEARNLLLQAVMMLTNEERCAPSPGLEKFLANVGGVMPPVPEAPAEGPTVKPETHAFVGHGKFAPKGFCFWNDGGLCHFMIKNDDPDIGGFCGKPESDPIHAAPIREGSEPAPEPEPRVLLADFEGQRRRAEIAEAALERVDAAYQRIKAALRNMLDLALKLGYEFHCDVDGDPEVCEARAALASDPGER